eukprot:2171857-Prorocentrum_lima.AAC.1
MATITQRSCTPRRCDGSCPRQFACKTQMLVCSFAGLCWMPLFLFGLCPRKSRAEERGRKQGM